MKIDIFTFWLLIRQILDIYVGKKQIHGHICDNLMWEIVVLDYFEVGDSTAGLFCCGRLWYWTILLWEILLLDFFAVGDSDAGLSS